jgi:hypothetical protein
MAGWDAFEDETANDENTASYRPVREHNSKQEQNVMLANASTERSKATNE